MISGKRRNASIIFAANLREDEDNRKILLDKKSVGINDAFDVSLIERRSRFCSNRNAN